MIVSGSILGCEICKVVLDVVNLWIESPTVLLFGRKDPLFSRRSWILASDSEFYFFWNEVVSHCFTQTRFNFTLSTWASHKKCVVFTISQLGRTKHYEGSLQALHMQIAFLSALLTLKYCILAWGFVPSIQFARQVLQSRLSRGTWHLPALAVLSALVCTRVYKHPRVCNSVLPTSKFHITWFLDTLYGQSAQVDCMLGLRTSRFTISKFAYVLTSRNFYSRMYGKWYNGEPSGTSNKYNGSKIMWCEISTSDTWYAELHTLGCLYTLGLQWLNNSYRS